MYTSRDNKRKFLYGFLTKTVLLVREIFAVVEIVAAQNCGYASSIWALEPVRIGANPWPNGPETHSLLVDINQTTKKILLAYPKWLICGVWKAFSSV